MNELLNDYQAATMQLSQIARSTNIMNNSLSRINQSIDSLNHTLESGFSDIQQVLNSIDATLFDMLEEQRHFHLQQYIQNDRRNELLESIDTSLKTPNQTASEEKYNIGLELINRGKYEQALRYFNDAIDLNPLHYLSYIRLSEVYYKLGEYGYSVDCALESITHTENIYEREAFSRYLASKAYFSQELVDEAITQAKHAISIDKQAAYHYDLSLYLSKQNDGKEAMNYLKEAIRQDRNYFQYSLFEPAFAKFDQELHNTLVGLKKEKSQEVERLIHLLENLKVPKEIFQESTDYSTRGFLFSIVAKMESKQNELPHAVEQLKRSRRRDTYIAYCKSCDFYQTFKEKYNDWIDGLFDYLREEKRDAGQWHNRELASKSSELQKLELAKKRLKELKKPGLFASKGEKERYKKELSTKSLILKTSEFTYQSNTYGISNSEKWGIELEKILTHLRKSDIHLS